MSKPQCSEMETKLSRELFERWKLSSDSNKSKVRRGLSSIISYIYRSIIGGAGSGAGVTTHHEATFYDCDEENDVMLMILLADRNTLSNSGEQLSVSLLEAFVDGTLGSNLVFDVGYETIDRNMYIAIGLRKPSETSECLLDDTDPIILFDRLKEKGKPLCKEQVDRLKDVEVGDKTILADLIRFMAGSTPYTTQLQLSRARDVYTLCVRGPVRFGIQEWGALKKKFRNYLRGVKISRSYAITTPPEGFGDNHVDGGGGGSDTKVVCLVVKIDMTSVASLNGRGGERGTEPSVERAKKRHSPYSVPKTIRIDPAPVYTTMPSNAMGNVYSESAMSYQQDRSYF